MVGHASMKLTAKVVAGEHLLLRAPVQMVLLDHTVKKRWIQPALRGIVRTAALAKGPQDLLSACVNLASLERDVRRISTTAIHLLAFMAPVWMVWIRTCVIVQLGTKVFTATGRGTRALTTLVLMIASAYPVTLDRSLAHAFLVSLAACVK